MGAEPTSAKAGKLLPFRPSTKDHMEDTPQTAPEATPAEGQQGITRENIEQARYSLAVGLIMVETVTNAQGVEDEANKIMDLITNEHGNPTLTTLAALFNIAIEHAGDFKTPEIMKMIEAQAANA